MSMKSNLVKMQQSLSQRGLTYLHDGGVLLLEIHAHDRILRRPNVDGPALFPFKSHFHIHPEKSNHFFC